MSFSDLLQLFYRKSGYDGLVQLLGGTPTHATGWALGVERLVSLLSLKIQDSIDVFIVSDQLRQATILADTLRNSGLKVDMAFSTQKFAKQLDKANKLNAQFAIMLGSEEVEKDFYTIKNLSTGDQYQYDISDTIACIMANKQS